ncbi:MAG: hypothetical protein OXU61_08035 [Gammaproteobacteria bacterium]|nr:hypothetical protein [Gammaproteobacteria bacterium]
MPVVPEAGEAGMALGTRNPEADARRPGSAAGFGDGKRRQATATA